MNSKYGKLLAFLMVTLFIMAINPSISIANASVISWEYEGANNPTQWSNISPEFEMCQFGKNQSPINISNFAKELVEPQKIEFNYQPSKAFVTARRRTIQVSVKSENTIQIDGSEYKLLQFHFHTPSEHTINGKSSAMELHLVHQNNQGKLAVVGVMMNEGKENPIITSIWDKITDGEQATSKNSLDLDTSELLSQDKTFISYSGSLTTPPCSEEVSWNLLLEPIEVSPEQIQAFETLYPYNARPIQPLNGRAIKFNSVR